MFENLKNNLILHKRGILTILATVLFAGFAIVYVKNMVENLLYVCGNGVIEGHEQCDDGNLIGGDGCSSYCKTTCGDGIRAGSELCDDGNTLNYDGCSSVCETTCGDGKLAGFEQCDDGNKTSGDGCSATCVKDEVRPSAPAKPATKTPTDTTSSSVKPASPSSAPVPSGISICGDGIVDTKNGEVCEPDKLEGSCPYGQTKACKICSECKGLVAGINHFCGDGIVDTVNGEECDNGKKCSDQTVCASDEQCKGIGNGLCLSPAEDGCSETCKNEEAVASASESVVPGTWSIAVQTDSEPIRIVAPGAVKQKVASYLLSAENERVTLNTLTIINDLVGAFNNSEDAPAIKEVIVECLNPIGGLARASGPLVNGSLTLTNFKCMARSSAPTTLNVYVTLLSQSSDAPSFSGEMIRLGIQNPGASPDETLFDAEGSISKVSIAPQWVNAESIKSFMVRNTIPIFTNVVDLSPELSNGLSYLYGVTVNASGNAPVSLAGLTFQVSSDPAGVMSLSEFRLTKGKSVSKRTDADVNIFSERGDVGVGSGNSFSGGLLGISFNTEEVIPAGESQVYYLRAEVKGASTSAANSLTIRLLGDNNPPILSRLCGPNSTTGKIYDTDGAALFGLDSEFSYANRPEARVIWSDGFAAAHLYPTVEKGIVTAGSGSCDWTNGWGLGIEKLEAFILTK